MLFSILLTRSEIMNIRICIHVYAYIIPLVNQTFITFDCTFVKHDKMDVLSTLYNKEKNHSIKKMRALIRELEIIFIYIFALKRLEFSHLVLQLGTHLRK